MLGSWWNCRRALSARARTHFTQVQVAGCGGLSLSSQLNVPPPNRIGKLASFSSLAFSGLLPFLGVSGNTGGPGPGPALGHMLYYVTDVKKASHTLPEGREVSVQTRLACFGLSHNTPSMDSII